MKDVFSLIVPLTEQTNLLEYEEKFEWLKDVPVLYFFTGCNKKSCVLFNFEVFLAKNSKIMV
jgi:hypothetical protein